jgi:transcriptional regulator with XRE-family HTH domain
MTKTKKIDKQIGEAIELQRKIAKKTRKNLAEKLGLSYQQIQNYESGKHRVSASCLYLISNFFKVSINNFFPKK